MERAGRGGAAFAGRARKRSSFSPESTRGYSLNVPRHAARSRHNAIFTLDHAARIGARLDMTETDVSRERAEKRDSIANEHRETTDDQALYESDTHKFLNRDPAVHVQTAGTGSGKLGDNLGGRPGHHLNDASARMSN